MKANDIKLKVKQAMSKVSQLSIADIQDDAKLGEELEIDSLAMIEAFMEIQTVFELDESHEEKLAELQTVNDIAEYLQVEIRGKELTVR